MADHDSVDWDRDDWADPDACEHDWTEWRLGPFFPREERFCALCGAMEWQEIRAAENGDGRCQNYCDGSP